VALVPAGAVTALVFGFWLMDLSGLGLDDGWLAASLGLLVLSAVLGALGGQRPKRARLLAERSDTPDGPVPEEVRRLLADRLSDGLNVAATLAAVAVLLLMVWQP
jgi:uncharacterized membrane protein